MTVESFFGALEEYGVEAKVRDGRRPRVIVPHTPETRDAFGLKSEGAIVVKLFELAEEHEVRVDTGEGDQIIFRAK